MKPWVYFAGPYSAPDPVQNTRRAILTAGALYETDLIVPIIPHLTMLFDFVMPRPYEFWLKLDQELLQRCDAVFRLAGASSGADGEVTWAKEHGLPIFEESGALLRWASAFSKERATA